MKVHRNLELSPALMEHRFHPPRQRPHTPSGTPTPSFSTPGRPLPLPVLVALCLALTSLVPCSLSASFPATPDVTVFFSPNSTLTASCGQNSSTPCGSLSIFTQTTAATNPSKSYRYLLAPGRYTLGNSGLDVTGLKLSIQPQAAPASPGAPSASLDCAGGSCVFADCAISAAGVSACPADAVLEIGGISVQEGASSSDGGCLRVQGQSLSLNFTSFSGCSAAQNGGAALVYLAPTVEIADVTLTSSTASAGDGGGMAIISSPQVSVSGLSASKCSAPLGSGGALNVTSSFLSVVSSIFMSSSAMLSGADQQPLARGGGCLATSLSTVTIVGSTFTACNSNSYGGCFSDHGSVVTINGSTFSSCRSETPAANPFYGFGGCISTLDTPIFSMDNVTVTGCSALQEGGCFFGDGSNSTSQVFDFGRSTFSMCNLSTNGGGGGAIKAIQMKLTMHDSVLEDNSATAPPGTSGVFGGALEADDCNLAILRCNFSRNTVSDQDRDLAWGGAVYTAEMVDPSQVPPQPTLIEDCRFETNQAGDGGALYVSANGVVTVSGCVFVYNTARVSDAGAFYVSSPGTISNCSFYENTVVGSGGALHVSSLAAGDVTVTDCHFINNVAQTGRGGAVSVDKFASIAVLLEQCLFSGNSAPQDMGGAADASADNVTFLGCVFEKNWARLKGGAVMCGARDSYQPDQVPARPVLGHTVFVGCTFQENGASLGGGAIFVRGQGQVDAQNCSWTGNNAILGGALLAEDYGVLNVIGGTCNSNNATAGGGCFTVGDLSTSSFDSLALLNNHAGSEGGAVRTTGQANMVLKNCTVQGNSASQGGGIWVEMYTFSNISGSRFIANQGDLQGGALFVLHSAAVVLDSTLFTGNTALHGGGLSAAGTVRVNISSSTFTANAIHALEFEGGVTANIFNTTFSNNNGSTGDGGAVLTGDTSVITVASSNFSGNTGNRGAGIFADGNSSVAVTGCLFVENNAAEGGGVFGGGYARLDTTSCVFSRNNASQTGAGIALTESTVGTLTGSSFYGNRATLGGAAVYISRGQTATEAAAAASILVPAFATAGGGATPASSKDGTAADFLAASFLDPVQPLEVENLTFSGNRGVRSQGSAYLDASYENATRSDCTNCTAKRRGDSIGSLPSSFLMVWPGSNDTDPGAPFVVRGDKQTPITGLTVLVMDAHGSLASEDFSSVAAIDPSPVVSGLLHGVAVAGVAEMPPLFVFSAPADGGTSSLLNITVQSSVAAFPPIQRQLQVLFCPEGEFFEPVNRTCLECPVGSWCGTALGAQTCPDGTFSFFPGATSSDSCLNCPGDTFANGTAAVTCAAGILDVSSGWWLDPQSVFSGSPAVYSCDVLDGCAGFTFVAPSQAQCSPGYSQVRLCSTCQAGFYSVLKTCYECQPSFTQLFPLFVVLMLLAWFLMGFLSNALHTVAIFIIEIQMLTFIGTYNLVLPKWVTSIIEYFQIMLFVPDIIGPACSMSFGYPARWAIAMIIPAAGVLIFSLLYLLLNLYIWFTDRNDGSPGASLSLADTGYSFHGQSMRSVEDGQGPLGPSKSARTESSGAHGAPPGPDVAAREEQYNKWRNSLIHGCTNWLDLCYAGVTYRCLQAFYEQYYGAAVMGAAPTIYWWSTSHVIIFSLSVLISAVFVAGAPLCYALVLTWGKRGQLLSDPIFKRRWGWMISRYEYEFFWWHLSVFARRISLASIAVFGVHVPEVQLAVTISLQAVRIGLQYGASPFKSFSHDILNSLFALAEFLFTIALASFHYLQLQDASIVVFGLSMGLIVGPTVAILLYESLNRYIERCNQASMVNMWRLEKLGKSTKSLRRLHRLSIEELVHPRDIADWFRPHILYAFLNHAKPKEARILLRVRDRYQACKLAGLGKIDWIKHLTKSQLYAVMSQALLGAEVGEVTIARMPVKSSADGQGIEEVQVDVGTVADGNGGGTAARPELRPRTDTSWPPRLDQHVRWTGSTSDRMTDDIGNSTGGSSLRFDPSLQESDSGAPSGHLPQPSNVSDGDAIIPAGTTGALTPWPVPIPAPVADPADETHKDEAADAVPEMRRSSSMASGRGGSDGGWASQGGSPSLATFDPSPQQSPGAPQGLSKGPSLGRSASGRRPGLPPGLPRAPSPLGMAPSSTPPPPPGNPGADRPPLPPSAGLRPAQHDGPAAPAAALAAEEEEPEFLEARMNMADLTLTFQRHLALLVRSELCKADDSLRLLLRSDCLPVLLAWLTSPASTVDDQVLLREMVNVVREGAYQEAGGLQWYTGLSYFLRNMWRRKPAYEPTLADISSR